MNLDGQVCIVFLAYSDFAGGAAAFYIELIHRDTKDFFKRLALRTTLWIFQLPFRFYDFPFVLIGFSNALDDVSFHHAKGAEVEIQDTPTHTNVYLCRMPFSKVDRKRFLALRKLTVSHNGCEACFIAN